MNKLTSGLVLVIAALLSQGCASGPYSDVDCTTHDWRRIGVIDGRHGDPAQKIEAHIKKCEGSTVDPEAYEVGRKEGLLEYCTAAGGYTAGTSFYSYQHVCPKDSEPEFLKHFAEGRRIRDLKSERQQTLADRDKHKKEIDDDHSVVGDIAKGYHLLSGTSQTQTEDERAERLADEIHKSHKTAPEGAIDYDPQIDAVGAMTTVFASGVGFVVGFGSGHAIEGRYLTQGYKWTAIDAVIFTSLFVTSNNFPEKNPDQRGTACNIAFPVEAVGLFVSRIWQVIEILGHFSLENSRYKNETVDNHFHFDGIKVSSQTTGLQLGPSFTF